MQIKLDPTFQQNFIFKNQEDLFNQMMQQDGERFRALENRRTLRFIKNNQAYFIKQHFGIGYKEIIKNLFCLRWPILGAEAEYLAINKLAAAGVAVPKIIGYGKRYFNPAHQQSFLITEELKNTQSLEDLCKFWAIQKPEINFKIKLINAVAELTRKMHQRGINHRGFYLCHILIDLINLEENNKIMLYSMDLHRAQIRPRVPKRWLIKDIAGLYFSSMDTGVNKKDIFRFLKKYFNLPIRKILFDYKDFLKAVLTRAENLHAKFWAKQIWKITQSVGAAFMPPAVETLQCNVSPFPLSDRGNNSKPIFLLNIKKNILYGEKILRVMPNKRVIFYGNYNNHPAVIKFLFQEKKYQQELAGYQSIQNLNIQTPKLLNKFKISKKLFVLIYEYISPDMLVLDQKIAQKIVAIQKILAILHDHQLHYKDVHLDNFIFSEGKVFLIDTANIHSATTSDINNIAELYALLPMMEQGFSQDYFQRYLALRHKKFATSEVEHLPHAVLKVTQSRYQQFKKRSLRNCRDIGIIQDKSGLMLAYQKNDASYDERKDLYAFFENPEEYIKKGECLKQGNTCVITKVMLNHQWVIIKSYQRKIKRALLAWQRAYVLKGLGIPTPAPIAVYTDATINKAYFIMEYIQGNLLSDSISDNLLPSVELNRLRAKAYRILFALYDLGEIQRDTKATNFIINQNNEMFLLDLDGIRTPCGLLLNYYFKKSIARFYRNWE